LLIGEISSYGNDHVVDPPNSNPANRKEEKQSGANLAYIKAMDRGKQDQEQDHGQNSFVAYF